MRRIRFHLDKVSFRNLLDISCDLTLDSHISMYVSDPFGLANRLNIIVPSKRFRVSLLASWRLNQ